MADKDTYQERIRKNTEKLRDEKDGRRRAILQKQIQRDNIMIELVRLNDSN